jgi:hypothetical protein
VAAPRPCGGRGEQAHSGEQDINGRVSLFRNCQEKPAASSKKYPAGLQEPAVVKKIDRLTLRSRGLQVTGIGSIHVFVLTFRNMGVAFGKMRASRAIE